MQPVLLSKHSPVLCYRHSKLFLANEFHNLDENKYNKNQNDSRVSIVIKVTTYTFSMPTALVGEATHRIRGNIGKVGSNASQLALITWDIDFTATTRPN